MSYNYRLSIILCTYNRCENLKVALSSLCSQEYDNSFNCELIVVDNNSKDKSKEVVDSFKNRFKGRLKYVLETNQGLSHARNRGIREAEGEIVAFTDDDVVVHPAWFKEIKEGFEKYGCVGMGGKVIPIYSGRKPAWLTGEFTPIGVPRHNQGDSVMFYARHSHFPIGANMAFKKNKLIEYGLFDITLGPGTDYRLGEDYEFFKKMAENNEKIAYLPSAIVYHPLREDTLKKEYYYNWYFSTGKKYVVVASNVNLIALLLNTIKTSVSLILEKLRYLAVYYGNDENKKFHYEVNMCFLRGKIVEYSKSVKKNIFSAYRRR